MNLFLDLWHGLEKWEKPEDVAIMQFTGQHDKNGKEIYFDDLLREKSGDIWRVVWEEKYYSVQWRNVKSDDVWFPNRDIDSEKIEVIGNIYENRDLLL